MRVFISWSGAASKAGAELLKDFLEKVVQAADVWVSSRDIEAGDRWAKNLGDQLTDINFGIVVLTPTNISAPWIMFEAGALSKTVASTLVPLRCGVERLQLSNNPLSQFQDITATKEEILALSIAINGGCARPIRDDLLRATFEKWWPEFEANFEGIDFSPPPAPKSGKDADSARLDKMEKALEGIFAAVHRLERQAPPARPSPALEDMLRLLAEGATRREAARKVQGASETILGGLMDLKIPEVKE